MKEEKIKEKAQFLNNLSNNETAKHFHKVTIVGGGEIIEIKDSKKMKFASEIIPTLDKEHFKVFRPMFEFILSNIKLQ